MIKSAFLRLFSLHFNGVVCDFCPLVKRTYNGKIHSPANIFLCRWAGLLPLTLRFDFCRSPCGFSHIDSFAYFGPLFFALTYTACHKPIFFQQPQGPSKFLSRQAPFTRWKFILPYSLCLLILALRKYIYPRFLHKLPFPLFRIFVLPRGFGPKVFNSRFTWTFIHLKH